MIKVTNSTTPNISHKYLQNIRKKISNKTYVTFNIYAYVRQVTKLCGHSRVKVTTRTNN